MKKSIIFDWDDVFTLGSTQGYYKCYHEAVQGVGVHLSPAEEQQRIAAKWGSSHEEEICELLKEKPELVKRACELYEDHLFGDTFVGRLSIVPGGADLLSRLAKSYTIALATGVHPDLLKKTILPKFNIDPKIFSHIVTAYDLDDPTHAKPHPHSAELILGAENIDPSDAIMVGDAANDVGMAFAAHIEPVVVLTGHLDRNQAENLGVKYIIEDVTKLETVLQKL